MKENAQSPVCQLQALHCLQQLTESHGLFFVVPFQCQLFTTSSPPSLSLSLIHADPSSDHAMNDEGKRHLLWTMSHFLSSTEVQDLCCRVLSNIAITGELPHILTLLLPPILSTPSFPPPVSEGDVLYTTEFIQPVCTAMRVSTP